MMDWQLIAVAVLVAGAAAYVARQTWRTWAGRKSGCGGCGCASKSSERAAAEQSEPLIPSEQLTLRRRK